MYCAYSSKWGLFGRNTRSAFRRTPSRRTTAVYITDYGNKIKQKTSIGCPTDVFVFYIVGYRRGLCPLGLVVSLREGGYYAKSLPKSS